MEIPSWGTVSSWVMGVIPILRTVWKTLNGPAVGLGRMGWVNSDCLLVVRNVRGGDPVPRVFLEDVTDGRDHSTGDVTSPVEIYRANSVEPIRLYGTARAVYPVFTLEGDSSGARRLRINTLLTEAGDFGQEVKKGPGFMYFRNHDQPLERQGELRLEIRVVFYEDETFKKHLTEAVVWYSVKPVPAKGVYEIRPIRPPHMSSFDAERLGLR